MPTSRVVGRAWWLPLLILMWSISTGCTGSTGSDGSDDRDALPLVPYELPADVISPPPGASVEDRAQFGFAGGGCVVGWLDLPDYVWEPDASDSSGVTWISEDRESERAVGFEMMRWSDRSRFDQVVRRMSRSMQLPCFESDSEKLTFTEPLALEGLPAGALAVRWQHVSPAVTVVMFDADTQAVMAVTWRERERNGDDNQVPTDELVDVANLAWSEFLADNPPLN